MRLLILILVAAVAIHFLWHLDAAYYVMLGALVGGVAMYFVWESYQHKRRLKNAFKSAREAYEDS